MKAVYSLYLEPVTESEMRGLVNSLKSSAPGYDNIRSSILKLSLPVICTPLTYICNLSLQEGVFPDELKIANVIPLFKNDDPELFNDYRPVSLLCTVSKLFEKIMYNRLLSFFDKYKILFSYQFGFRKHHSTYMALMTLMDNLINCLDNGEYVIGIFLISQRPSTQLIIVFYYKSCPHMVSAEVHWIGFKVISLTDINL